MFYINAQKVGRVYNILYCSDGIYVYTMYVDQDDGEQGF